MQTFALIAHFRDITQSEEGGAGFGASKQGCLDALGGGDPVGELVMIVESNCRCSLPIP